MGLLRSLLTLPVSAPMQGTFWVARKIEEAADREHNDPAALRKALHHLEQQLLNGSITEDDYDEAETQILLRLKALQ